MLSALRPRRARNERAALRVPRAVCAIALAALLFPASALAHTGTATVACDAADFQFTQFAAGANTVNYKVTVDRATATQGTFTLGANGGREGALHVPLALHGTHTVAAFAWWGPAASPTATPAPPTRPPSPHRRSSARPRRHRRRPLRRHRPHRPHRPSRLCRRRPCPHPRRRPIASRGRGRAPARRGSPSAAPARCAARA